MLQALLVATVLSGCATAPSCYVGFALLPPSPVVICGVDLPPPAKEPLDARVD